MVFCHSGLPVQTLLLFLGLFSPLDSIYPAENADEVYQTLDAMPLFWKQASITDDHLLTMYV
jgi:hypothetical protein